jgi:hypothetical protein
MVKPSSGGPSAILIALNPIKALGLAFIAEVGALLKIIPVWVKGVSTWVKGVSTWVKGVSTWVRVWELS